MLRATCQNSLQVGSSERKEEAKIKTISQTDIPGVTLFRRGKVRDVYTVEDKLLIVATDRLSAFDVVLREQYVEKRIRWICGPAVG